MNEKLQYAKMLEIPVSTCNVTYKRGRHFFKKRVNEEKVKEKLLGIVNKKTKSQDEIITQEPTEKVVLTPEEILDDNRDYAIATPDLPDGVYSTASVSISKQDGIVSKNQKALDNASMQDEDIEQTSASTIKVHKKKKRFSVIGLQIGAIAVLIGVIIATNAFWADSGINTFIKGVFSPTSQAESVDTRVYSQFETAIPLTSAGNVYLNDGVMSLKENNSVYAPCGGVVESCYKDGDKYTVTIKHNENFKTVFGGIDLIYVQAGDSVVGNIPFGYIRSQGATACFYDGNGNMIADYHIAESNVVWNSQN